MILLGAPSSLLPSSEPAAEEGEEEEEDLDLLWDFFDFFFFSLLCFRSFFSFLSFLAFFSFFSFFSFLCSGFSSTQSAGGWDSSLARSNQIFNRIIFRGTTSMNATLTYSWNYFQPQLPSLNFGVGAVQYSRDSSNGTVTHCRPEEKTRTTTGGGGGGFEAKSSRICSILV